MLMSIFMPLASRIWLPAVDTEMLVKCLVRCCHSISGVTPNDAVAWSLTSHATASATLVSATWRAYSSAPTSPATTRANTMMQTSTMDSGSRRKRRFLFLGAGSSPGVASVSVGPAGGMGGAAGSRAAAMFGGRRAHPFGLPGGGRERAAAQRPGRRRASARSAARWGADRRDPGCRDEPHADGPSFGGPCGFVTRPILPYPRERNAEWLRSTAMLSRAWTTRSTSMSATTSCGSEPADGDHLAQRRGHQAAAHPGRRARGRRSAPRPGRPDRPRRRSSSSPARGPGPAASTARACRGPHPRTRRRRSAGRRGGPARCTAPGSGRRSRRVNPTPTPATVITTGSWPGATVRDSVNPNAS